MLNKIYFILLAASLLVMAFFTYYSWSWLQSIGSPRAVVENFNFHSELSWVFLWVSSVILLVFGNAVHWTYRRSWPMWVAAGYFAAFVLIKYFWLDRAYLTYRKTHGLFEGSFDLGPFFAVVLCLVAVGIVFFDQFIVSRLAEKMHPKPLPAAVEESVPETENAG